MLDILYSRFALQSKTFTSFFDRFTSYVAKLFLGVYIMLKIAFCETCIIYFTDWLPD